MARASKFVRSPGSKGLLQLALGGALPLFIMLAPAWAGEGHEGHEPHGHESGAGGADDFRPVPAFFLGYDPSASLSACLQVAPGFGTDEATLRGLVERAFKEWSDYIVSKKLDLGGSPYILTQLSLASTCDGTENLTYYFGVENDAVERYRSQFERPFGFAQLLPPASSSSSFPRSPSRGFVWIAPPSSILPERNVPTWNRASEPALYGLILHETGHVFGNGHLDGTVMTEKIGEYLENDTDPARNPPNLSLYTRIDAQVELVPCMECRTSYTGLETLDPMVDPKSPDASDWVYTFKRLVGREPERPLVIRYERTGSPEGAGRLVLFDTANSYSFDVRILNAGEEHPDSTPLFLGVGGKPLHSFGMVYNAQLTAADGQKVPLSLNYNMSRRRVIIKPQGENEPFFPRPFFTSAY